MAERKQRPVIALAHPDEAEHRRLIAQRANAGFPKDGTEAMTAPLRLMSFAAADLPDATLWAGTIVYVPDGAAGTKFRGSDGSAWVALG